MPKVSKITVYPIKSLDGVEVETSHILPAGALKHDREYALMNPEGRHVNGKKYPKIHALRADYNLAEKTVSLTSEKQNGEFHLNNDSKKLEEFFSDYFGFQVIMRKNSIAGFPDDSERAGPTFVSQASLEMVNSWFPEFDLENIRRRFRANIEIAETTPFWEDQFIAPLNSHKFFQVGDVQIRGRKKCARCVVPTRNPFTGEVTADFMKKFMKKRAENLPDFTRKEDFDHFYYLTLNTNIDIDQVEKTIKIGDKVESL